VQSALMSADLAEEIGLPRNRIILSAKVSQVQDLIAVYSMLSERSDHALHLGLTEAGMGSKGIVASSAAMGYVLQHGIGDTIRVSLTPEPNGDRTKRSAGRAGTAAGHGFPAVPARRRRLSRLRPHDLDGVPGAGAEHRTTFARTCRSGAKNIRASKRSTSPSWAASSTVRARASMPISASRCRARVKIRPRPSSSTARRR
jgi:hypothetical protein